jgi:predicted ATP-grasp superfamily ATP-dependent carboligase
VIIRTDQRTVRPAPRALEASVDPLTVRPATDVLLLDAGLKQTLAAARSLGGAGLRLILAERRDPAEPPRPPAFSSRWSMAEALLPDFDDNPDEFAAGVLGLVTSKRPSVVVPASDQSIACLRPWRSQIERHTKLAMASEAALNIAVDKQATLAVANELGIAGPRTAIVEGREDIRAVMAEIGYPAVVKPRWPWLRDFGGARLFPSPVLNETEAFAAIAALQRSGAPVLVQELLNGLREGLSMFRVGGKVVGEFAHVSVRTTPMLGGACAVRESIPMPGDLRAAAVSLIDAIDLEGYSQIEFRRDARGRPVLMEVNPRLSGSVELASRSGVDFPLMIWQWASGARVEGGTNYRSGVRLRWLTGDGRWLLETLRAPGRPDSVPALRALASFAGDFARPSGYDYFDIRDPLPAIAEGRRVLRKLGRRLAGRPRKPGPVGHANETGTIWYQEK